MLFLDLLLLALLILLAIHPSVLSSLPADTRQPRDPFTSAIHLGLVALRVIVYVAVTLVVAVLNTDASYVGVLSPIMQRPQGPASQPVRAKLIDTLTIPKPSPTQLSVDAAAQPKAAIEPDVPVKEPEPIIAPEPTIETIVPQSDTISHKEELEEAAAIEPTVVVKQTPIPIVSKEAHAIASPVSPLITASETVQDVNTSPVSSLDKSFGSVHSNSSHVDSSEEHSDDTEMTSSASGASKPPSAKHSIADVATLDDAPATPPPASSVHTAASNSSRLAQLAAKVTAQSKPVEPQPSQNKRRSIIPLRTSSLMRRTPQAPKPESDDPPAVHKTLSMRLPKAASIFHHHNNQHNETTKAPRQFFTLSRRSKVPESPIDQDGLAKPKTKSRFASRKRITNLFH